MIDLIARGLANKNTKSYTTISESYSFLQSVLSKYSYDNSFTISPSATTYVTGRNLLQFTSCGSNTLVTGVSQTVNGVTVTLNQDGTITLNGTCTSAFYINTNFTSDIRTVLTNKTIKITATHTGSQSIAFNTFTYLDALTYGYNITSSTTGATKTGTITGLSSTSASRITVSSGVTYSSAVISIMVEITGSNDVLTAFESPVFYSISSETKYNTSSFNTYFNAFSSAEFGLEYNTEENINEYVNSKFKEVEEADVLYGKTIAFYGDSLCYGQSFGGGWATIISENNPNSTIINLALGGSQIASNHASGGYYFIITQTTKLTEAPDYLIGEGYVNDYLTDCVLGTITSDYTSTLNTTTFYGGMEYTCKTMVETYPSTKYGFIITHTAYSADSLYLNSLYIQAIKDCCNKWGVPYLDLSNTISPIIDINKTSFYSDGLHYNEAGYRTFIAPKIESWIRNELTGGN